MHTLAQIQDISQDQRNKLAGLQKQEEDYNRNVQVVVESDEQQMKLNQIITDLKNQLFKISTTLEEKKDLFRDVKQERKAKFLEYFDKVSSSVEDIYKKLSGEGTSSLTLLDRESPYDTQIIYDFKPPNK